MTFGRLDCKPTLRYVFRSIVTSLSLALQGISFNRLLRQYPSHSQESLSIDCRCVSFSRTLRNFFQSIVSSVSLALKGVSFNRLLRQYQSRTLRNFFQSLVIEWLRQYLWTLRILASSIVTLVFRTSSYRSFLQL